MKLIAKNLAKAYKKREILHDVNLEIAEGEIVGLLGPNGAGKTTCFYMILGLVKNDKGLITLDSENITNMPVHERARYGIGYLPQEPSVFRKLSVEDNILAILQHKYSKDENIQLDKLETLLTEFNLKHIRKSLGISLSGGERRRLEIARALASEPKFILLDEPFAGIDPISIIDIKANIKYLAENKNIGIIITDHNVRETLDICNRAYILNRGHVIAEGEPKQILANKEVRDVYLGEQFEI